MYQSRSDSRLSKSEKVTVFGFLFIIAFILLVFWYAMFVTRIPPGSVGVVVNMMGNEQGVESKELHVGMHVIAPWKDVYKFPTFEQNHTWEGDESFVFQTQEGLAVRVNIGITFNLKPEYIPILFQKYRRGMDEITDIFIHNNVRDAINRTGSHFKVEELYGPSKDKFLDEVQKTVSDEMAGLGFNISRIYLIGRLHFPDTVVVALNSKIEATQRAQQRENELREAEAEAKKQIAAAQGRAESVLVEARSKAEANILLSKSVTPQLIQYQAVQKWNGEMPHAMGGTDMPFMIQLQ